MLTLSRNGIRNLASGEIVYSRGLQYYKDGRVKNVVYSKSNHQYRMNVNGRFPYSVTITETGEGAFEHTCNCPSHVKEKGACKHVVAALLFLLKYQEKQNMETPQNPEEKKAYQVLEYFCNQDDTKVTGEVFHLTATISLPSMLKGSEGRAYLTLRAGSDRLYKIQSLRKFLLDYNQKENIILGKEFKFIANESEFDKESQRLLDYLLDIVEVSSMSDTPNTHLFNKAQLSLSRKMLVRLVHYLKGSSFDLELYGKLYSGVKYQSTNPKIKYVIDAYEDAICFDYNDQLENVIPLADNGELIYFNGVLYKPDRRFIRNYVPFYNALGSEKKPLIFRNENRQRFLEEILPKLHDTMDIDIPEELKSRYLTYDLKTSIYFDKYNNGIKADLHFIYGEYEFSCFEDPHLTDYIIVRDKEREEEIMQELENLDFEPHSSFYFMQNDSSIYNFLQNGIDILSQKSELYYSEDYKKIGVKNGGTFRVGLRVSSEIDLLEMDLEYDDVSKEELKDLLRSFQLKKKYYRLKNGSFLNLEDDKIRGISELLENLNVKTKNLDEGPIRIAKSSAFYLDDALRDTDYVVEKSKEFNQLIDRILTNKQKYVIPAEVEAELRPYQKAGFSWLRTLADNSLGGILADDMGLGKTLQAITYITSEIKENSGKFLIVCPTSLVYNWQDEFQNFSPNIKTYVCSGTPQDRQNIIENVADNEVLITSYPLIRRDIAHYRNIEFHTVFIDEAQFIKNAASQSAQAVKLLRARNRFALTGTPIENSLSELWSIFDFIMPNYLMSHSKFVNRFEKKIVHNEDPVDAEMTLQKLNKRIHPFVLRRMKTEVLKELPEKIEEKILTDLTDEQKKVYVSYMAQVSKELSEEIDLNGLEKSKIKILAALTRLRQICCHPSTFLDNYDGGSGKLDLLMEVTENALANGHRILLFSQFTSMLDIIMKHFKEKNYEFFYLDGNTPVEDRLDSVKRFNSGEGQIFLVSLKAGGTGLNLTGADTVIHYDPWWNPAVEEQATDRVYRIGQKNKVHVIRLLTRGTIEEKIYRLQHAKKELSESVIQSKEVFINKLTREELEDIFRLD